MKRILIFAFLTAHLTFILSATCGAQEEKKGETASPKPLSVVWSFDDGLKAPESICYDSQSGFLFLSQIGAGGGKGKDGDGWISKFTIAGQRVKDKWATGLNAPKGIRTHGSTLWVSDIDRLVAFDIETGEQKQEVQIKDAQFLNDVATGPNGAVFVSDLAASKVYRHHQGKTTVFASGPHLEHPNGLLVYDGHLILGGWGRELQADFSTKTLGRLSRINLRTGKHSFITPEPTGHLDGIESDGRGGFIVSDWFNGKVFRIKSDGASTLILQTEKGAADLAYIQEEELFILPEMMAGKLTAYLLHKPTTIGKIEVLDAEFKTLLADDAEIEVLGEGFEWSEGPVWVPQTKSLLFSDIPNNRINRWRKGSGVDVFMARSGYTGKAPFEGVEPGTNGLTLDSQGRLVMCCHGDRAIKRVEKDGSLTVLASHYQGARLNSPNDLIYHSNGDLYFTDPPYGLPKRYDDPRRELDWCGVYRLTPQGKLTLLTKVMTRPNGIGFSPDEKTLYVAQSDGKAPIWRAFEVKEDGALGKHRVFADASPWIGKMPGGCDGLAVDQDGRLWATGPGGVLIFTSKGKLIGRLNTGQRTANCTFGDDGSTLYITADMFLCRVRTKVKGVGYTRGAKKAGAKNDAPK